MLKSYIKVERHVKQQVNPQSSNGRSSGETTLSSHNSINNSPLSVIEEEVSIKHASYANESLQSAAEYRNGDVTPKIQSHEHSQITHKIKTELLPNKTPAPETTLLTSHINPSVLSPNRNISTPPRHMHYDASVSYSNELARTNSFSSSRKEWKDQMRKKYLPSIFVNKAFDTNEVNKESVHENIQVQALDSDIKTSLHYYMSGDYHHDNLNTDSLPRHRHLALADIERSESEGQNGVYDEFDIRSILDKDTCQDASPKDEVYKNGSRCSSFKTPNLTEKPPRTFISMTRNGSALPDVVSIDETNKIVSYTAPMGSEYKQLQSNVTARIAYQLDSETAPEELCCQSEVSFDNRVSFTSSSTRFEETTIDEHLVQETPFTECHATHYVGGIPLVNSNWVYNSSPFKVSSDTKTIISKRKLNEISVFIPTSPDRDRPMSSFQSKHNTEHYDEQSMSKSEDYQYEPLYGEAFLGPGRATLRSDASTPVFFTFDEEIDKGFEEALSVVYEGNPMTANRDIGHVYAGTNISLDDYAFRTHAIISRTHTPSCASSENQNDFLPPLRCEQNGSRFGCNSNSCLEKSETSPTSDITSAADTDNVDSGFNSGLDTSNSVSGPGLNSFLYSSNNETDTGINSVTSCHKNSLIDEHVELRFESEFTHSVLNTKRMTKTDSARSDETSILQQDIEPVYF